jgi:hypothetical protein
MQRTEHSGRYGAVRKIIDHDALGDADRHDFRFAHLLHGSALIFSSWPALPIVIVHEMQDAGFLVPKLCLGTQLSAKLCFVRWATELLGHCHSQTEFENEAIPKLDPVSRITDRASASQTGAGGVKDFA